MEGFCRKSYKEMMLSYFMADDTGMILIGLAVLLGMGLLFWKFSNNKSLKITEFVRDDKGRVLQIIEK